ncbi:GPI transamidase component PIG-T [Umbelopsis sp. PMI_123]|nr:GPI transamidase component PIG-T [Umbelopsis sp. PMI_123]
MPWKNLPASILLFLALSIPVYSKLSGQKDSFQEDLLISPLNDGKLLAHFQFTALVDAGALDEKKGRYAHYGLFPKSIGQIIDHHRVQELHLTFTQGRWQYEDWGYPAAQSAGTGVELWAWMKADDSIENNWRALTNTLSGLFCASLNFIDDTLTSQPELSFRPEGAKNSYNHNEKMREGVEIRYGILPHENVCTENLTPWIKLLPCKSKAGIATLLNAHKLYDTNYHSMAIHIRPVCQAENCTSQRLELVQTVTSVLDPVRETGRRDWSFSSLFGREIESSCPVSDRSAVTVLLPSDGNEYQLTPSFSTIIDETDKFGRPMAYYNLSQYHEPLNLKMTWNEEQFSYPLQVSKPRVFAHKYMTGYGHERGGVTVNIFNNMNESQEISYFDSVPWFLKLYLHTLEVSVLGNNHIHQNDIVQDLYYQPAVDRSRPQVLEMKLRLPADSVTAVSIDFDKVFLKYTEHRPDANRGFDVGPAVITTLLPPDDDSVIATGLELVTNRDRPARQNVKVYTEILLASLPTPDFSMPYNVITLTCTVIALFFGSIFNLLIREFMVIEDEIDEKNNDKNDGKNGSS